MIYDERMIEGMIRGNEQFEYYHYFEHLDLEYLDTRSIEI